MATFPELGEALAGARRVALVGVGSELRGDDAAGVLVARRLAAWCRRAGCARLAAFAAGAAPENFSGEIVRFAPDCVVFLDAADLRGREPGAIEIVPPEQVAGLSFSTHMLPAPIFLDYLEARTGCRSIVVGIQLGQKDVMARPSPAVAAAVRRVVAAFQTIFAPAVPDHRQGRGPKGHRCVTRAAMSAAATTKTTSQIVRRRRRAARSS